MKNKLFTTYILIFSIALIVGCSGNTNLVNEQNENNINIITSFYPMYIATSNLIEGVDNINLKCLASPDVGCLHDYQLTVNDMITLENADIFIINGGGMESFLDKAVSTYPSLNIVNASEGILENSSNIEHNHEHSNETYDENPHVWVSVSLYINQVENICENLKSLNPENAEIYESNKDIYIEKLNNLKDEMHENLDILTNKNIVTFHEGFYYFAKEFDLNVVAVIEREPGTSPSAGEIANIIEKVKKENVNAIFVEPQYSKTAANTISSETGVKVYELDPVVSGKLDKEAYINIMKENLNVLLEALK